MLASAQPNLTCLKSKKTYGPIDRVVWGGKMKKEKKKALNRLTLFDSFDLVNLGNASPVTI